MGRRAYMNRLALGRSPYEVPDNVRTSSANPTQGRVLAVTADDYVQQYDERGHPVNPASKLFGRELRRAKNDVLSTMGIVVSGEDGNLGATREREKVNLLMTENDYGLAMTTLDQVTTFLGSWWAMSLGGRIRTFKSYSYVPLINLILLETKSVGFLGFFFPGIPAWAASFVLSICRNQLLEPVMVYLQNQLLCLSDRDLYGRAVRGTFSVLNIVARGTLFALFGQTYMFSLLQSLHLVPIYAIPSLRFFLPFSESSLIQFPPLPTDYSLHSLNQFALGFLAAPFFLIYLYFYLRLIIEARIYRVLRRRFPKPDRPDELSIRVAWDNDLIEWTVPSLGRRSDEEARRSNFTVLQEIKYEFLTLRNWILSWFGLKQENPSDGETIIPSREERLESLRHRIEQLHELRATSRTGPPPPRRRASLPLINPDIGSGGESDSSDPTASTQTPEPEALFNMDDILTHDRFTQSPIELSPEPSNALPSLGRTGIDGIPRPEESLGQSHVSRALHSNSQEETTHGRSSRSNTLFSRPSSPESSPPTSPRVRASLVHQNSEVITMQLELLTNRNRVNANQTGHSAGGLSSRHNNHPFDPRSLNRSSEFADAFRSSQARNGDDSAQTANIEENNDLSSPTAAAPSTVVEDPPSLQQDTINQRAMGDLSNDTTLVPMVPGATVLPDGVEEPNNHLDSDSGSSYSSDSSHQPVASRPHTRRRSRAAPPLPSHRVTILSSHPVDSLASHLASLVTTVLFIPLESLYLRSLALSYLSSPASGNEFAARGNIRSLSVWAGGGGRKDTIAYMSKLTLVMGLQSAVSTCVWWLCTKAVRTLGQKAFGWGKL